MKQPFTSYHNLDEEGRPSGGWSRALGVSVDWQMGPLGRGDGRQEPNGAFVETLIAVAIDRIEFYNGAGFGCSENYEAIGHLKAALAVLEARTARREAEGTEGTHEGT